MKSAYFWSSNACKAPVCSIKEAIHLFNREFIERRKIKELICLSMMDVVLYTRTSNGDGSAVWHTEVAGGGTGDLFLSLYNSSWMVEEYGWHRPK